MHGATVAIAAAGGGEVACAYYSLAGADWPADYAFYEEELSRRIPARRTVVVNDAIGAIRCGPDDGVGCSFVCGTGTALGARPADGRLWHVSCSRRRSSRSTSRARRSTPPCAASSV